MFQFLKPLNALWYAGLDGRSGQWTPNSKSGSFPNPQEKIDVRGDCRSLCGLFENRRSLHFSTPACTNEDMEGNTVPLAFQSGLRRRNWESRHSKLELLCWPTILMLKWVKSRVAWGAVAVAKPLITFIWTADYKSHALRQWNFANQSE